MRKKTPTIQAFGDHGILVRFGDRIDPTINHQVHRLAMAFHRHRFPWFCESVPGYASLFIVYDPLSIDLRDLTLQVEKIMQKTRDDRIDRSADNRGTAAPIDVPVVYGGSDGPDLEIVAGIHHMTPEEVIRIHTQTTYMVYMIGFMPGFPYMGPLPSTLETPRLNRPRQSVQAGSVGIAGLQTGIYPSKSPGGWRILGRTPLKLFDCERDPPCLFQPGQTVRFYALDQ